MRRRTFVTLAATALLGGCASPLRRSGAGASPDVRLEMQVKSALLAETGAVAAPIEVESRDAVVTLRGLVASEAERARVLAIARGTPGARRVVDGLTVRPPH